MSPTLVYQLHIQQIIHRSRIACSFSIWYYGYMLQFLLSRSFSLTLLLFSFHLSLFRPRQSTSDRLPHTLRLSHPVSGSALQRSPSFRYFPVIPVSRWYDPHPCVIWKPRRSFRSPYISKKDTADTSRVHCGRYCRNQKDIPCYAMSGARSRPPAPHPEKISLLRVFWELPSSWPI